jgi:ABC-2 type transport system ATP-binding protein
MAIIEADGLTKTYRVFQKKDGLLGAMRGLFRREFKEVKAVDGVRFAIEPGEMVAFLGPNGAGKTTTLKMLSGLIYPTGGTARVLGYVPWQRVDSFRRRFSLVMGQKNQLWWDLPAADSFELHREIYSIPHADFKRTLAE